MSFGDTWQEHLARSARLGFCICHLSPEDGALVVDANCAGTRPLLPGMSVRTWEEEIRSRRKAEQAWPPWKHAELERRLAALAKGNPLTRAQARRVWGQVHSLAAPPRSPRRKTT